MKKILLFITLILLNFKTQASTIYVNANATGTNNGNSWNNAYTNLQVALSNAIVGDAIWVATGTYKSTNTTDRTLSFVLKNGVNLYGGFAGTENLITQRDIAANPTTLSGDIGAVGDNSDNTNLILVAANITTNLTFDGFRVVSGNSGSAGGCSGFSLGNNTGTINIKNCFFYNNLGYYGAALSLGSNNIVNINNCDFLYNAATYAPGIFVGNLATSASVFLTDCNFKGNIGSSAGALQFDGKNIEIDRCLFTNNTSNQSSIIINNSTNSFKISNSLIAGNKHTESVIMSYGGNTQLIENCTIVHNKKLTDNFYSAIYNANNGIFKIYNSIIYGNTMSSNNTQIKSGNIVSNSLVENNYSGGTSIINSNPNFKNPGSITLVPFDSTDYDYSLQNTSKAINSGNNSFVTKGEDFSKKVRIFQNLVDMGAYEFQTMLATDDLSLNKKTMVYDYKSDILTIHSNEINNIKIFDLSGKLIKTTTVKNTYKTDLMPGLYIILLENKLEKIKISVQ